MERRAISPPAGPSYPVVRWWLSVVMGTIVSMPLAWLLSYAAVLPFFLGLFFFALFGLVIGATMHRIAAPGRPYRSTMLVVGTTVVVLTGGIFSIVKESRDFPHEVAVRAGSQTRYIGHQTIEEFRAAVSNDIRRFFRDEYPPGGALGYIRWILVDGELTKDQIEGLRRTARPVQRGYTWAIRVVLSFALLGFGIGSQTLLLRLSTEPTKRAIDVREEAESA